MSNIELTAQEVRKALDEYYTKRAKKHRVIIEVQDNETDRTEQTYHVVLNNTQLNFLVETLLFLGQTKTSEINRCICLDNSSIVEYNPDQDRDR